MQSKESSQLSCQFHWRRLNKDIGTMNVLKLEEALHSNLVIFELMGMQFFSLKKLSRLNAYERPSVFRVLLVFLVIFSVICFLMFLMTSLPGCIPQEKKVIDAKNVLMFSIAQTMQLGMIISVICCVLQSYFSSKDVKKLFLNSREMVESMFREFDIVVDFEEIKKAAWKRFAVMTIFFLSIHGWMTYCSRNSSIMLLTSFCVAPVSIFLVLTVYKFIFFVVMVNRQLEGLTFTLTKIFDEKMGEVEHLHVQIISLKQTRSNHERLVKIQAARKIYNLIHENSELVNSSNGLTVLICIVAHAGLLVLKSYEMFTIFVGGEVSGKIPEATYCIVIAIAEIVSMVAYCQKTENAVS